MFLGIGVTLGNFVNAYETFFFQCHSLLSAGNIYRISAVPYILLLMGPPPSHWPVVYDPELDKHAILPITVMFKDRVLRQT